MAALAEIVQEGTPVGGSPLLYGRHPDPADESTWAMPNGRVGCPECGAVFSTLANFDRHLRGEGCLDPARVGLVPSVVTLAALGGQEFTVWHQKGPGSPFLGHAVLPESVADRGDAPRSA